MVPISVEIEQNLLGWAYLVIVKSVVSLSLIPPLISQIWFQKDQDGDGQLDIKNIQRQWIGKTT